MDQHWTCPECSKTISTEDTFVFARDHVAHFYGRQPRDDGEAGARTRRSSRRADA